MKSVAILAVILAGCAGLQASQENELSTDPEYQAKEVSVDQLIGGSSSIDPKKIDSCLNKVSEDLKNLKVPDEVKTLAEKIRSLNANLQGLSLTNLITDERASLDVYTAGLVKDDQLDSYVQQCSKFAEEFLGIVGSSECGNGFMEIISPHNKQTYNTLMENHDDVDAMVGYAEACFIL